jgi:hypothetical protein
VSHVEDKQLATTSHVGGIDSIEKPIWIVCKPKFPCNIFKGNHLAHVFPILPEEQILWSLSTRSSDSKSFEVSSQSIHPLVDEVVVSMKYSANPTLILGGDALLEQG